MSIASQYLGNPNLSSVTVDVSDGIACSRTSGTAPCHIQVSASAITATGTRANGNAIQPFEDLHFEWDFGDAAGTLSLTNPCVSLPALTPRGSINPNDTQIGPNAAYRYEQPGTYTVTLRIYWLGLVLLDAVTQEITVTAGTWTDYWFSSDGTGDGLSEASPSNDVALLNAKALTANVRINIKRGSTWSSSSIANGLLAMSNKTTSNCHIRAYGVGARPKFTALAAADPGNNPGNALWINSFSGSPFDNVVIDGLCFEQGAVSPTVSPVGIVANENGHITNAYFNDCEFTTEAVGNVVNNNSPFVVAGHGAEKWGIWNCRFAGSCNIGCYHEVINWFFMMGCTFDNVYSLIPVDEIYNHYVYGNTLKQALYRWNDFSGGSYQNYVWNANWNNYAGVADEIPEFHLYTENFCRGVNNVLDAGSGDGTPSMVKWRNIVCSHNDVTEMRTSNLAYGSEWTSLTVRYNRSWNNEKGGFLFLSETITAAQRPEVCIYHNYKDDPAIESGQYSGIAALMHLPIVGGQGDWSQKMIVTDNVIATKSATAKFIDCANSDNTLPAGSIVDRNKYFAPNGGANLFMGSGGLPQITFANWKSLGWDANSSVADPGWIDPDNGNFNVNATRRVQITFTT